MVDRRVDGRVDGFGEASTSVQDIGTEDAEFLRFLTFKILRFLTDIKFLDLSFYCKSEG